MLRPLIDQAELNGFEFRKWFLGHIREAWPGSEGALNVLSREGRHYTLLFSHEFARAFWRSGSQIAFAVPRTTYHRVNGQGEVVQVTRKGFMRRTMKPDVWKYHLSQMATAEDPIEYMSRFLAQRHHAEKPSDGPGKTPPAD
jgi:hypothetical protein